MLLLHHNYNGEKDRRLDFLANYKMYHQKEQLKSILGLLVPDFIQDYLTGINNRTTQEFQEVYEDVDIVFCDIVGFDDIIKKEEEKTVEILDNLFRAFDDLCQDRGLQKIETVGKTYMAATGIRTQQVIDHQDKEESSNQSISSTERTIVLAFDMMSHVEHFTYGDGQ